MKLTQLVLAVSLAAGAVSVFAAEAEQIVPPTGTLTRAEVKAELARAQAAGEVSVASDVLGSVDTARTASYQGTGTHGAVSRDAVREQAHAAARNTSVNTNYVGG